MVSRLQARSVVRVTPQATVSASLERVSDAATRSVRLGPFCACLRERFFLLAFFGTWFSGVLIFVGTKYVAKTQHAAVLIG